MTAHFLGFGTLPVDTPLSPKSKKTVTTMEPSNKFTEKLKLKQAQMEQQLLENRVRKLRLEEDRLQKQINLANKNSEFADKVRQRKDEDIRNKEMADHMEQLRIERQHAQNQYNKNQILNGIAHEQKRVFDTCAENREDLNNMLRSNYEKFFTEKSNEQNMKASNAANMYNQRQEMMAKMRQDRHCNYADTTSSNVG